MEKTISELVMEAGAGDQQAMSVLYEKTSRKAYYLALQLVKDEDQAQDILQDSYIKAFGNLYMLEDTSRFQGWLDTIVINKSKDYLKKWKPILFSQMASEEEEDGIIDFEDTSGQFSPEASVDYRETKRLVQEMINELPEEQRMAVVLHYLEYYSVKQIAEIMECSEGTVKSRLNYGRKAIKEKVLLLEKRGTKLYCMPLVPFLYWLFRQQVQAMAVPYLAGFGFSAGAAAGNAAAQSVGTGIGAQAMADAGSAGTAGSGIGAAGAAASAAGSGIAVKAAAIVASVVIVGGGGGYAGYHVLQSVYGTEAAVEETEEEIQTEAELVAEETEPEETEETAAVEENTEILALLEEYGTQSFSGDLYLEEAQDMGDYYEIQARLCVPVTFEEDPLAGKSEGDTISFEASRINGKVVELEIYDDGVGEMTAGEYYSLSPWDGDEKYHLVGGSDVEPALEIYVGTLKLRKDAHVEIYDSYEEEFGTTRAISPEDFVTQTENYEARWLSTPLTFPEDEPYEDFQLNPDTGRYEATGETKLRPGYLEYYRTYEIGFNEDGEVESLRKIWFS